MRSTAEPTIRSTPMASSIVTPPVRISRMNSQVACDDRAERSGPERRGMFTPPTQERRETEYEEQDTPVEAATAEG